MRAVVFTPICDALTRIVQKIVFLRSVAVMFRKSRFECGNVAERARE